MLIIKQLYLRTLLKFFVSYDCKSHFIVTNIWDTSSQIKTKLLSAITAYVSKEQRKWPARYPVLLRDLNPLQPPLLYPILPSGEVLKLCQLLNQLRSVLELQMMPRQVSVALLPNNIFNLTCCFFLCSG